MKASFCNGREKKYESENLPLKDVEFIFVEMFLVYHSAS